MTGATQGDKVTSDGQYGFSVKNSSLNIYGEMSISSLKNQVSLLSSQNIIDSVIGGEALLDGKTGSAQKGDIKNQPTSQNSLSRLENRASAFTNIDSNKIALDASENRIQSSSDANLLVGGKASVQLISGNATSRDITIDTTEDIAAENYTFANSYVVARDLNLKASSNHVETTGNSKTIYGGDATLLLQAADATAGDVTYQNGTKIFADVDANAITRATGSVINASDNAILSAGSANKVVGGNAVASLRSGNAAAGNITSNSNIYDRNPEYHDPADPEGNLPHKKAYAYSEIYADSMTLQANKNRVEVADKGSVSDLIGGYTALNLRAGSATSGAVIHSGDHEQSSDKIDAGANIDLKNTVLEANDNSVKLLGTLNDGGNIYGGDIHYAITPGNAYFSNGSEIAGRNQVLMDGTQVSAINNLVELGEFAKVENGGQLYGGRLTYNDAYSASQYDLFTGNRLHVSAKSPLYFQDVANFEYYQFTLTPQLANKNIAIINADTITLGSHNGNYGDYQDRNSNRPSDIKVVGMHSGDTLLGAGDQFILMQAGAGKLTGDATAGTDQITQLHQGISLIYDVETVVEYENDRVITVIKSGTNRPDEPSPPDKPNPPAVQVNPKLKAIGDGRLAMEELLLRGADNLTGIMRKNQVDGYVPFADFYAGHSKYTNGSTIRANEYIITMGVTYQKDRWVIAPIIEYGWSDYKTDTPYGNHLSSRGSGDNYYYGLGLLSRYNFENGFYLDGGIRYGRSRNKFNSKDLAHVVTKELASYKISSPYWGAHLSLGYQIAVAERQQLDVRKGSVVYTSCLK
ncbi:autotransporter outer membrane beta-barrel domain-containing protein [Ignatzschineria cameli]|uniref:Autotransporter domain-containing protein n=1 Tax=Ignatzschineria cameli TaxID=2182793 RepID=A0ABX5L4F3_9GAMM|nr:autotransporter outer membrane beta-barrel domain-containing protein [Ignatzschineria cameli]PWD91083.1 hypothetical protein DC079_02655 [Ignatzschineria cameli]PWD92725.1 hypothetical protein DC081_02655 [Ignatzschineria cameli]PWD93745.1 hypothetical protein DC078_02655 [Ignatzschineria cameli]